MENQPIKSYDLIVIGGGLAGLTASLTGQKQGLTVALIEKGDYPRHRVCGEYVSQEVVPIFQALDVPLTDLHPPVITHLKLTSPKGRVFTSELPLGALGLSRFGFDRHLYQHASGRGVSFFLNQKANQISWDGRNFQVQTQQGAAFRAPVVISAFGKRSNLDRILNRRFFTQRSPYMGVKFHAEWDMPSHLVELHNFRAGYCGVSRIESGHVNICYLTTRDHLRRLGSIEMLEKKVLYQNPHLAHVLQKAKPVWNKPLTINEISFARKGPVENHILMAGDAAGLIAPLSGNGMAMAIQAGHAAAGFAAEFLTGTISRPEMEQRYATFWRKSFASRLWVGRNAQTLFQQQWLAEGSVRGMKAFPSVARWIIQQTHG